jgi:tetratricopeptide (TPR) repeat protein
VLWKQRKRIEAREWLEKAYRLESIKDAFNLTTVLEIHQLLMDTHLKDCDGGVDRSKMGAHQAVIEIAMKRVRDMPQDGNAAVYYKAAAELYSWAGMYTTAVPLFNEAIELLKVETSIDCSGLISACKSMLSFCKRNLQGQQDSPMMLEVENVASNLEVAQGDEVHSSLRNLTAADFEAVKLIWQKNGTVKSPAISTSRRWRDFIEDNAATCWGALDERNALVGILVCGSDGLHCYLHQFGVDTKFNRQTVGEALFAKVKAVCSDKTLDMEFLVPHALTADITSLLKGIDLSPNPQEAWTA